MYFSFKKAKIYFYLFIAALITFICANSLKPTLKALFPLNYYQYIEKYSQNYNLDKFLVMSVISVESGFNANAKSSKDAKGLMQLREPTAKWCMETFDIKSDKTDLFDPELNIMIGCSYIRYLIDKYDGNTNTALAAYNAGEGNVSKWLKEKPDNPGYTLCSIPFAETENYIKKVNNRQKIHRFIYG